MASILTLTMNPALDVSTSVDKVVSKHKLRCSGVRFDPGGGGVNVARVIERLGGKATALYAVGGPLGEVYQGLLEAELDGATRIAIEGNTRQSLNVSETSTGEEYRFVLEGPQWREKEWRGALDLIEERLSDGAYVVVSGSLPQGVPDDFPARVARLAKQAEARCVVDASGAALEAALEEGVFLIKPNRRELSDLTGSDLDTREEQEATLQKIVDDGGSEVVALSLGGDGALFASVDDAFHIAAPEVEARSAVGAGDSFVAALVLRLADGKPLEDAARYAVAAGAAALLSEGTEMCRAEDVERLYEELRP
ncbi:1-phosphofructokinase family hexose kinase [Thioalkalivibrio sp.]|uniref:1-phosphofructokinase family hexose kinase n=1 Tax=Thioalkalivibrio sp. TaxID=2093813 RepID=UPI0012D67BE3|nr:1-phosphofructokinase family hexose kinase [Thioalkalivibrio sp.]TVP77095.1 MAG: 1-phosphofructokinase family hexose kinase [Thioalkalivibrio sp.]